MVCLIISNTLIPCYSKCVPQTTDINITLLYMQNLRCHPRFLNLNLYFKRSPGCSHALWHLRKNYPMAFHFFLLWFYFLLCSSITHSIPATEICLLLETFYLLYGTELSVSVQQSLRHWILPTTTMSGFRNISFMSSTIPWLYLSPHPNYSFVRYSWVRGPS